MAVVENDGQNGNAVYFDRGPHSELILAAKVVVAVKKIQKLQTNGQGYFCCGTIDHIGSRLPYFEVYGSQTMTHTHIHTIRFLRMNDQLTAEYATPHNIQQTQQQTSMSSAGFKHAIPVNRWL